MPSISRQKAIVIIPGFEQLTSVSSQMLPQMGNTRLRKFWAKVLKALHLTHHGFTFHSLCRSGATLAFNLNVPMQDIQSHGTWTSEAVWAYITQDHNAADTVAHSFRSLLKT